MENIKDFEAMKKVLEKTEKGRALLKELENKKVMFITNKYSRQQELADILEKKELSLDDTFKFSCNNCGKCCHGRDDMILQPYDLFNMAKALKLSTEKFVDKYCVFIKGSRSLAPLVLLKPIGATKRCPMLKNQKCLVYNSKPRVCALYPLGRYTETQENGIQKEGFVMGGGTYCGKDNTYTVREWLEKNNIPIDDEINLLWSKVFDKIYTIFRNFKTLGWGEEVQNGTRDMIAHYSYFNYDTQKPFKEQFVENMYGLTFELEQIEKIQIASMNNDTNALYAINAEILKKEEKL